MLQNQRACQLVRSKTGCEPLALAVAWGARTAGRCAAEVLGAVKHQRFSDQQLETFAARAPGICPKPVCDAGEPCPLPPRDDAVDVSVIVPVHNGERFLRACLDSILHQNTTRRLQVLAVEDGSTDGNGCSLGSGEAPVAAVRKKAIESGYGIVVESEGLDPTGKEEVKRCIDYLKTLDAQDK